MSFGFKSHAFVCEPKCGKMNQMGGHKSGQTDQGSLSTRSCDTNKRGGVGGCLECSKAKFADNSMVCALDGMEAILGNTFLDVYRIDVLRVVLS